MREAGRIVRAVLDAIAKRQLARAKLALGTDQRDR
jgi:hypothetical protein